MRVFAPLFLTSLLLISSCSNFYEIKNGKRTIANEIGLHSKNTDFFVIKSTSVIQKDMDKTLLHYVKGGLIELVLDPQMDKSEAFRIVPGIDKQQKKLFIYHSAEAISDKFAREELFKFMSTVADYTNSARLAYPLYELYYNVQAKDVNALATISKLRSSALKNIKVDEQMAPDFQRTLDERNKEWKEINKSLEQEVVENQKRVKAKKAERESLAAALDKASNDKQFKALVSKNDRKGAAQILRSYLPWEDMAPFEKKFWETQLEVMANPLPLEERILLYTGVHGNLLEESMSPAFDNGKLLSKEEALKDQKAFFMAPTLTDKKNTSNQQLRKMAKTSLSSDENGKAIHMTTILSKEFTRYPRSIETSPFLSLTPQFIPNTSDKMKMAPSYFIDPRLVHYNFLPGNDFVEVMLPLVTFPDDLAALYHSDLHKEYAEKDFLKISAISNLEDKLGKNKGQEAYDKITKNTIAYFKEILRNNELVPKEEMDALVKKIVAAAADGEIEKMQKLMQESKTLMNPSYTAGLDKAMTCNDLIELFWK